MDQLVDLISNATDGVCGIDCFQRISLWNGAAEDLLGIKAAEVLGKPCFTVFGGMDETGCSVCHQSCEVLFNATSNTAISTRDMCVRTKAGKQVWLSISTLVAPSKWQELTLVIYLMRDVTHQHAITSHLRQLYEALTGRPVEPACPAVPDPIESTLTNRERDVLRLLASGRSTATIAETLFISESTVRNHIHHSLSKLGVHNRLEAVTLALRNGLLQ